MIKFVVNGANRTGTHFLQSLLNDHPDINCYWDLFWSHDETPLGYASYRKQVNHPNRFNLFSKNRVLFDFLSDHFSKSDGVDAAGFLLKSETVAANPAIVRWFRRNDVKVIHLVRENHLMREVAMELRRQKVMESHARNPVAAKKIRLNTKNLAGRLEYSNKVVRRHRRRLIGTNMLEVKYERLVSDEKTELVRIFDFLNVSRVLDIKSEFYKTEQESPRAMIENYDEVAASLEKTCFSVFLD